MSEEPLIPDAFDQDHACFVLLPRGKKHPPIEKEWQKKGHSFREAEDHAKKGENIGIMAGGIYIGLDEDEPSAFFDDLQLPPTTIWETRPGRLGLWFKCRDRTPEVLAKYGIRQNQAQVKLFYNGQPVGEIKLERTYQVIPPSWKEIDGKRVDYEIIENLPPAEISIERLLSDLIKIGITFSKKASITRISHASDERARSRGRVEIEDRRRRKYAEAALENEVSILANTSEGERNTQLNKSAFVLGQFVSAGYLKEAEVIGALSSAADYAGLSHDEIEKTIRSGLEAGAKYPREVPSIGSVSVDELDFARRKTRNLVTMIKNDRGAPYEPEMFAAIMLIREHDPIEWAKIREVLKDACELRAFEKEAKKHEGIREKNHGPLQKIAERIPEWIDQHYFKTAKDTDRLYHYAHGVYLNDGEVVLKELIEEEFGNLTTENVVRDAIGKVKRRTYVDREAFNDKHYLNVRNGLLVLDTLELLPHKPEYLSTAQLGVFYNPTSTCPKINEFILEVANKHDVLLIEEIFGWLLWPDYNVHKAVMLLGPGRNGKGTLLRLITAFLGKVNVSNVTLQDLVNDKFAKADLFGKMANIGGDLPSKDLSDTASFRNLTGGDDNRAQEKYRPAFSFRNKAKLLFSANVLPRSPDDTYAFYSRWILIEFQNIFIVEKGTADPDLEAKLTIEEELSGLLNLALAGLKRLRENGWRFSYSKTVEDVEVMYKRNANPVLAFLMDECEAAPEEHVEKTILQHRFNEYAKKHNIRPLSTTAFAKLLKDQTEIPISDFRPWVENRSEPRAWLGLRFKSSVQTKFPTAPSLSTQSAPALGGASNVPPSTPSIVLPTPSLTQKEEKWIGSEDKRISKVGDTQTMDGVDGWKDDESPKIGPHPRRDAPTPSGKSAKPIISDTCPICGQEIASGCSSATFEGKNYCTLCARVLPMIRASAKALAEKNERAPTITEIHEDIAARGRPPRKEHMPAMLKAVGFIENEERWEKRPDASSSIDVVAKEVERLNADEKPIVPQVLADRLGFKIPDVVERLIELGYVMTDDVDPITHFCSWKIGVNG
jgi:P4 family phage/plasmid primase-like protien